MRSACESKDRELAALRLQVRGVEVHDVDAGVVVQVRMEIQEILMVV